MEELDDFKKVAIEALNKAFGKVMMLCIVICICCVCGLCIMAYNDHVNDVALKNVSYGIDGTMSFIDVPNAITLTWDEQEKVFSVFEEADDIVKVCKKTKVGYYEKQLYRYNDKEYKLVVDGDNSAIVITWNTAPKDNPSYNIYDKSVVVMRYSKFIHYFNRYKLESLKRRSDMEIELQKATERVDATNRRVDKILKNKSNSL